MYTVSLYNLCELFVLLFLLRVGLYISQFIICKIFLQLPAVIFYSEAETGLQISSSFLSLCINQV